MYHWKHFNLIYMLSILSTHPPSAIKLWLHDETLVQKSLYSATTNCDVYPCSVFKLVACRVCLMINANLKQMNRLSESGRFKCPIHDWLNRTLNRRWIATLNRVSESDY